MTASGPRSALVLLLVFPRHLNWEVKTPARIFVPPKSTPTRYSLLELASGIRSRLPRTDSVIGPPFQTTDATVRSTALMLHLLRKQCVQTRALFWRANFPRLCPRDLRSFRTRAAVWRLRTGSIVFGRGFGTRRIGQPSNPKALRNSPPRYFV